MNCPCITDMQRDPECPYHGRGSLRARITQAYDHGTNEGLVASPVSNDALQYVDAFRHWQVEAIVAALDGVDSDEVEELLLMIEGAMTPAEGTAELFRRYHLTPKEDDRD